MSALDSKRNRGFQVEKNRIETALNKLDAAHEKMKINQNKLKQAHEDHEREYVTLAR